MISLQLKSNIKKVIVSIILALSISLTYFVGLPFFYGNQHVVSAYQSEQTSLITNSNFSSMGSGTPASLGSSWTFNNASNTSTIVNGIINVYNQDNTFTNNNSGDNNKYKLNQNPGTVNPTTTAPSGDAAYKHLMINSPTSVARANYTSPSFKLAKSSYYAIEVWAKTSYDVILNEDTSTTIVDARASIYLTGLSNSETIDNNIEYFSTYGEWVKYTMFVSTNAYNEETLNLQFWLGGDNLNLTSKGAMFISEISVWKYNETGYTNAIDTATFNSPTGEEYRIVELRGTTYAPFDNANFENEDPLNTDHVVDFETIYNTTNPLKQAIRVVSTNDYEPSINFGVANPGTNGTLNNENVLFLYSETTSNIGVESKAFTIEKQNFYRLSVWAKSSHGSNTATLKLVEQNPNDEDDSFSPKTQNLNVSMTGVSNSPETNNWVLYSFFIEGHALENKDVKLQLLLGTEDNQTSGHVFFDNIVMQTISHTKYSSSSSSTQNTSMTFNSSNNQFSVVNGAFNLTNNAKDEPIYPLTPRNWTLSAATGFDIEQTISGVVNTNTTEWNKFVNDDLANSDLLYKNTPVTNPGQISPLYNPINNVLMIGNPLQTTQTYTSNSVSLSSGSYYRFSFTLATQRNTTGGANVKLVGSDFNLFELPNISTSNNEWETYNVYIRTNKGLSATIELSLVNTTGFAFFDNIELHTSNETEFNTKTNNINQKQFVVNLAKENFELFTYNPEAVNHTPFNWNGSNNVGSGTATFGVLDIDQAFSPHNFIPNPGVATQTSGNYVLFIASGDADTNYTVTSPNTFTLSSGEYYKVSVWVKTIGINQHEHKVETNDDDIAYLPGATLKLSNFESQFTAINTELNSTNNLNNWTQYVFYVNPSSSVESQVILGLGHAKALSSGYAYFDEIEITTLTKEEYTSEVESINTNNMLLLTELEQETPDEEEPADDNKFTGNNFDFLLLSSLITSVAILIAIMGAVIRKINFKKFLPAPKIKTSYDRRKTVEVEMNKKERIAYRQAIIDDLKLEFDEIDNEIKEYLTEYETQKAQLEQKQQERKEYYEQVRQAILVEIQTVKEQYKEESATITDEKQKVKAQKVYEKRVKSLEAKEQSTLQKANAKLEKEQEIAQKREVYLARQAYRKQLIQDEIDRIEREIEEIAKEEEKMWNEYRKAKEEAKKQKMEYMAKVRAEKRKSDTKKEHDKIKKSETVNFKDSNITSDDIVEVDENETDNK